MDSSPRFLFSIEAMQRNFVLDLQSKQRLHKLRFLKKVGCQKPCWDQARLSLACQINKLGGSQEILLAAFGINYCLEDDDDNDGGSDYDNDEDMFRQIIKY